MYLTIARLSRVLFWGALITGLFGMLAPRVVPLTIPLTLAVACGLMMLGMARYVRRTLRYAYRCPACGWVPFALPAWKCKECGFSWDTFATGGVCPQCGHRHDETACVRCRRISPNRSWRVPD
jgi:predicted RNA-binding Zn-ribbon protein involved in translation (DUF1610 family)